MRLHANAAVALLFDSRVLVAAAVSRDVRRDRAVTRCLDAFHFSLPCI